MKEIVQRLNQYFLFGILLVVLLYYAKIILVPIILGALLAMLMAPVCRLLESKGFNRASSCSVSIIILLIAIAGIVTIIVVQVNSFAEDISEAEQKGKQLLSQAQIFIEDNFNIKREEQESIAREQTETAKKNGGTFIGQMLGKITTTVGTLVLMLVYCFLFLYNKEKFENFFVKLYSDEDSEKVKNIVGRISLVSQKYLTGRVMSILIISTEYSIALSIIGLKNAVLLGCIAGLLTIIPYIGTVLGGLFPFVMALVTEDTFEPALWVAASILIIQTIDNYFVEPNIVGGEVNLSAMTSILSIIAGGIIWGVAGMVLFIPILGIIKIICDHIESLKPIGFIIGDPDEEQSFKIREWFRKKFKRS
jgi:predicted PurR-regulated permease PerM